MKTVLSLGVFLLTIFLGSSALGGTLVTTTLNYQTGLAGINNLDVDGTFYDVTFYNGYCYQAFDGSCDQSSFDFSSQASAEAAAQALLAAIETDVSLDSNPRVYAEGGGTGCNGLYDCYMYIPFALNFSNTNFQAIAAINGIGVGNNATLYQEGSIYSFQSTSSPAAVFALFSEAQPVPGPSSLLLLLTGLLVLGVKTRSSHRAHVIE